MKRLAAGFALWSSLLAGSAPAGIGSGAANPLLGRWTWQQPYVTSELVLNADGSGSFDGDALRYTASQGQLSVVMDGERIVYAYRLEGGKLLLSGGDLDQQAVFMRARGDAAAPAAPAIPPPSPAAQATPRGAGSDQLSQLLMSSAWCSFSYSGTSGGYNSSGSYGRSSSTRVQFLGNGSWRSGSSSEGGGNNAYGGWASDSSSGGGGRWQVQGGQQLLMSEGDGPLQAVALSIAQNSNGWPIITADGTEYSMCD